jgi:hypothetical protein
MRKFFLEWPPAEISQTASVKSGPMPALPGLQQDGHQHLILRLFVFVVFLCLKRPNLRLSA